MTIHIRIWRFSLAFELELLARREPEPDLATAPTSPDRPTPTPPRAGS